MEENISNNYHLKLIDLRLVEITKIWRDKSFYILNIMKYFLFPYLLKLQMSQRSTLFIDYLLKFLYYFWVKWRTYPIHFWFQQISDDLFIKYEKKLLRNETNNQWNKDSLNSIFIITDLKSVWRKRVYRVY